jgi:hypothetical protein
LWEWLGLGLITGSPALEGRRTKDERPLPGIETNNMWRGD